MKPIYRMCILGCLLTLLAGCVTETVGANRPKVDLDKQLQAYIDLGVGYIGNGEYLRAKDNLNKALALIHESAAAHNALALLFQVEGETGLADSHFQKAISSNPDLTQAQNNYGAFLFGEKRYSDAIKYLTRASEDRFYQHRAQVFENLGVCHLKLENSAKAEHAFLRATQLNSKQSRALLELAVIRFSEKSFVEANRYYRQHTASSSQSARSLLLCIKLARVFDKPDEEASCSLTLRHIFPNTDQFLEYQNLAQ